MKIARNVPKTLAKVCRRYADKIELVENEGKDGYWIFLKDGYWNPHMELSYIHEWSIRNLLWQIARICPEPNIKIKAK